MPSASIMTPHPLNKMREYTSSEFPWEYREYTKYSKHIFPNAFKDEAHFKQEYDKAPLVHLSHEQLKSMDYATIGSYMHGPSQERIERARQNFSYHRDVGRIENELHHGKMAPPIVLKHSKGLRILGGNTRMSLGAAHGINIPVKLINISDRH